MSGDAMDSTWVFVMWTVYEKPKDFPEHFIARRWEVRRSGPTPTPDVIVCDGIDELRWRLEILGLHRLPRHRGDEPQIVETWI